MTSKFLKVVFHKFYLVFEYLNPYFVYSGLILNPFQANVLSLYQEAATGGVL